MTLSPPLPANSNSVALPTDLPAWPTAELLVSELVTNAVKTMAGHGNQAAVRLRLSSDNARFLIEVQDADPRPPAPKDLGEDDLPDVQEEGGRGLFLVAALSVRWDWYPTQEPTGKVVWCEIQADRPELFAVDGSAFQPSLPRRLPRVPLVRPAAVVSDPDILRRIRDGLRDLDDS